MLRSFTIRNFRGFSEVLLPSLTRVNLVTGKNNVGKTTVLEALFLYAGCRNPDLPGRIEALRGRTHFLLHPEGVWGWLFPGKRTDKTVEFVGTHDLGWTDRLRVTLKVSTTAVTSADEQESPDFSSGDAASSTGRGPKDLILEHERSDGSVETSRAFIERNQLKVEMGEPASDYPGLYLPPGTTIGRQDAERYSTIDSVGKMNEVVELIGQLDGRVRRLSLAQEGPGPVLKGDIGLPELVPVYALGQGLCRFLSMVLAVGASGKGIVLVDEIENGLHYSAMADVWRGISHMSRKWDVQVVATTHSWECIRAAFEAFRDEHAEDLSVYRLDRVKGDVRAVRYDAEALATSVEGDLDVRGW